MLTISWRWETKHLQRHMDILSHQGYHGNYLEHFPSLLLVHHKLYYDYLVDPGVQRKELVSGPHENHKCIILEHSRHEDHTYYIYIVHICMHNHHWFTQNTNLKVVIMFAFTVMMGAHSIGIVHADSDDDSKTGHMADSSNTEQARHTPPLQQLREGVSLSVIQCNAPRELYLRDSQTPVCLRVSTYEKLSSYGIDLTLYKSVSDTMTALLLQDNLDLTDEEKFWLTDNPTIRVAYDPAWFPYEYVDESGQLAGVTAEYRSEFERAAGADFVQIPISDWTDALDALENRRADVIFMVANTTERLNYMDFTRPHSTISTDIVTLGNTPIDADDLADLRVAIIKDFSIESWLDENRPDIGYMLVDSFEDGFKKMQTGDVDALLGVWGTISHYAKTLEIEGLYNAGPTGHEYNLSIGYRNDQPTLGIILQKTLDHIPAITVEQSE